MRKYAVGIYSPEHSIEAIVLTASSQIELIYVIADHLDITSFYEDYLDDNEEVASWDNFSDYAYDFCGEIEIAYTEI